MLRHALVTDRNPLPAAPHSWFCLTFQSGWQGLSIYFLAPDK
jgi:hypothetical protein